jgi:hypothetical protein
MNSVATLVKVGMLILSFGVVGCKGTAREYCEKRITCQGGSSKDEDACTDTFNGQSDVADDYECGDQFDSYLDCMNDHSACRTGNEGNTKTYTTTDSSGNDACQSTGEAYRSCLSAAHANYYSSYSARPTPLWVAFAPACSLRARL